VAGYSPETLQRAKTLRKSLTEAKQRLWGQLRGGRIGGFKFRRQQPIGPYIADFVCQEKKLVVEADGSQHAENDHDVRRDAFLANTGYQVLRFWNNDILINMAGVKEAILAALTGPHPSAASRLPPSPSRGEGFIDGDSRV
jgi:very-short-patch-repair endonuclease